MPLSDLMSYSLLHIWLYEHKALDSQVGFQYAWQPDKIGKERITISILYLKREKQQVKKSVPEFSVVAQQMKVRPLVPASHSRVPA